MTGEIRLRQSKHQRAAVVANMYLLLQTPISPAVVKSDTYEINEFFLMGDSYKEGALPFPTAG